MEIGTSAYLQLLYKAPTTLLWGFGSFAPAANFCHNDSRLARSTLGIQSSLKHCYLFLHPPNWSLGISGAK